MAVALASPSASPSPSAGDSGSTNNTNSSNAANNRTATVKTETTANEDKTATNTGANTNNDTAANSGTAGGVKRKPSRRANTAERRATHNAVERQRRETLNGRFLDLAALLPNLSQIRRPSKSSIVNSSIAHVHASRRHRLLASRELRMLRGECDALRRELNEWRSRNNLPTVEEPIRSEAFNIIISGELDVLVAEMGAEMAAQGHGNSLMDVEEDEDMDEWGPAPPSSHGNAPPSSHGAPAHSSHGPAPSHGPNVSASYPGPGGHYDDEVFVSHPPVHHGHGVHHGGHPQHGMMMNGHPMHQGHPSQMHHMHAQHPQHPQGPFGYHTSHPSQQFAPGSMEDDRHFLKGNPFAHNVAPRPYEGNGANNNNGNGALFTPPATRDGLPPSGVAGLTKPININTNVSAGMNNGGASSPAQSVHSVHSAHSPGSHHGPSVNGDGSTPPPPSAISQFSGRSGSGSPVGYELASSGSAQPSMERRPTYPGPGGMMYGGEMYGHGHGMHGGMHHGGQGYEMRHGGMGEMRGMDMRHGQMVGAGAGGGLFGMML